jgi:hypothetical protein
LDFSLVFRWFSASPPTLFTVVSKKNLGFLFWQGFFLGFYKPSNSLGFWSYLHLKKERNRTLQLCMRESGREGEGPRSLKMSWQVDVASLF